MLDVAAWLARWSLVPYSSKAKIRENRSIITHLLCFIDWKSKHDRFSFRLLIKRRLRLSRISSWVLIFLSIFLESTFIRDIFWLYRSWLLLYGIHIQISFRQVPLFIRFKGTFFCISFMWIRSYNIHIFMIHKINTWNMKQFIWSFDFD
jgi:hypothetical protein